MEILQKETGLLSTGMRHPNLPKLWPWIEIVGSIVPPPPPVLRSKANNEIVGNAARCLTLGKVLSTPLLSPSSATGRRTTHCVELCGEVTGVCAVC